MKLKEFLERLNAKECVEAGSEMHNMMCQLSGEAMRITCELNTSYHTPDEIRELFSKLTGKKVDDSFMLFPPFYTDCGKNIMIGKNVFINSCCNFQDQGGITIGDGAQIGHKVVLATLNHGLAPDHRGSLYPLPIIVGKNVWIGAAAVVMPGVTIGANSIVGAGSVVTKDIPANSIAVGNPCRVIKSLTDTE